MAPHIRLIASGRGAPKFNVEQLAIYDLSQRLNDSCDCVRVRLRECGSTKADERVCQVHESSKIGGSRHARLRVG